MTVSVPENLSAELALIFRITHIRNVPWILEHGLHCESSRVRDPDFVSIGSEDVIPKRAVREVPIPPGGALPDYVPFYFTPRTPMLYNIKTGSGQGVVRRPMSEIVVLVSSLHRLRDQAVAFVFTDRHALMATARFSSDLADLDWLRWGDLRHSDFARDADDPGKFEQYQAEALAHHAVPLAALLGIACFNEQTRGTIVEEASRRHLRVDVACRPRWFV